MRAVAAVALALLAACTPMRWAKPDAGSAELERDLQQCRQEAWREARWRVWLARPFGPAEVIDAHGRRLLIGSPFGDPFADQLMEESRLAHFCMRAKGWQLEPAEPTK